MLVWAKRILSAFLAVPIAAVVGALVIVGPYLRDDLLLDHVVRAVALDWRDFGEDAAKTRLQYELDHQRIGMQVGDDDCALAAADGDEGGEVVRCAWTADVRVPFTEVHVPLAFEERAVVTRDGDLQ